MLPISELERTGSCNRFCGQCCSVSLWRQHPLWEQQLKPFFAKLGENEHGDCAHLQWTDGQAVCTVYQERPEMCRVFPNHPLSTETIPDCTFRFRPSRSS